MGFFPCRLDCAYSDLALCFLYRHCVGLLCYTFRGGKSGRLSQGCFVRSFYIYSAGYVAPVRTTPAQNRPCQSNAYVTKEKLILES